MNEIRQFFGKNLKRIRLEHGYTQEKLSEEIGINQRQLTRIETGRSFPSFSTLDNICNVLYISAEELFDFSNYCEVLKDGTNDIVHYIAHKAENNVIHLKEKFPQYVNTNTCKTTEENKGNNNLEITDETSMFQMARNLRKPVFVEYFQDGVFAKKVTYNPDGTSFIEISTAKNEQTINEIIDKLNSIKPNLPKLKFVKLAIECLENKSSIEKMKNVLEGMLL